MIGIYKITNKLNGKIYIGQSIDIHRRLLEHKNVPFQKGPQSKSYLHYAIKKYGWDNFEIEVLEECTVDKLNEREIYYIDLYKSTSKQEGYNIEYGGKQTTAYKGLDAVNAVLSLRQVRYIRLCYAHHYSNKEAYIKVCKYWNINKNTFNDVWRGKTYKDIMPEVLTEENKKAVRIKGLIGRDHVQLVKQYVPEIRLCRKNGEFYKDVYKEYSFINFFTFCDIWYNRTFKNLL